MRSQEDVEIERRLLLAILLSMAILFGAPYVYERLFPSPPVEPGVAAQAVQESQPAGSGSGTGELSSSPSQVEEPTASTGSPVPETVADAREILVENDSVVLRFSNVGAQLVGAKLLDYSGRDEEGLELVPQTPPAEYLRPLALYSSDSALRKELNGAVFSVQGNVADRVSAPATIVFEYRKGSLVVVKSVEIPAEGYELKLRVDVRREGRSIPVGVVLGTGIGELVSRESSDFQYPEIAYYSNGSVTRYVESDLKDQSVQLDIAPQWAALDSKYFAFVLADGETVEGLRMEVHSYDYSQGQPGEEPVAVELVSGSVTIQTPGEVRFFVGPKNHEILQSFQSTSPSLINYGWFGVLVRPLLTALKWIHRFIGNYGWSIILLTFLINLALFPIRYKQMASMQKMSAIQPELKSIQDKYKRMKRDDPRRQQMNSEVMALYKQHGVNPLGGCLPLVLQMPILFAFYRMLDASIELRGAPFMFWIHDLSKHDPYYVTPIVMGLTMVAQQKMTPATGDPTQRRMMMFLPIVFTFFFLNVSSGLAIYFLFSNLFAMMLQFGLQRLKPELVARTGSSRKKKE
jgi:YidC/Oxa1 family membrane protein insertase